MVRALDTSAVLFISQHNLINGGPRVYLYRYNFTHEHVHRVVILLTPLSCLTASDMKYVEIHVVNQRVGLVGKWQDTSVWYSGN